MSRSPSDVDADPAVLQGRIRRLEAAVAVRLEIVEPDGQPAFVLANSARPARGTFDAQPLMEGREEERAMPNFIFFDGHGDEVGGMLFGNRESDAGCSATRHLSPDGYRQDRTVSLFHRQDPEERAERLRELFGVNRVFLGSSDRDVATLVLKDRSGRPRIVLAVPDGGEPHFRILDEKGEPVAELP